MEKCEQNLLELHDKTGKDEQMISPNAGVRRQWNQPKMTLRRANEAEGKSIPSSNETPYSGAAGPS